ncbi:unnamed protein product, partial [Meganyctiphanes norvegica]
TFANETTQFLAPFEKEGKTIESTQEGGLVICDAPGGLSGEVRTWNPFNDPAPFSLMSEDHIFGAEFDKIRRGSQSSISNVKSRESLVMSTEDDPFGAAPFNLPGNRRSKATNGKNMEPSYGVNNSAEELFLKDTNSSNTPADATAATDTSAAGTSTGDVLIADMLPVVAARTTSAASQESQDDATLEPSSDTASTATAAPPLPFTRPPLEDRSKYCKLQNAADESDEDHPGTTPGLPMHTIPEDAKESHHRKKSHEGRRKRRHRSKRSSGGQESSEEVEGKSSEVFVCSVSDDDSIGSASDLKARINDEEYDYELGDRGDISETISSSVYHAECESVTTHEEDPCRAGESTDPAHLMRRGPKPSKAAVLARAKAIQEQENKKCAQDRLLGHEFGEKPLLLDDELDSDDCDTGKTLEDQDEEKLIEDIDPPSRTANLFQHVPRPFRKISHPIGEESHKSTILNMDLLTQQDEFHKDPVSSGGAGGDHDVFALAPFKSSIKKLNKAVFHSRSQPSSNTVSPLDAALQPLATLPPQLQSTTSPSTTAYHAEDVRSPEINIIGDLLMDSSTTTRLPVQAEVIYEESPSEDYPIYENVVLNSAENGGTVTPRYHHYENIPGPFPTDEAILLELQSSSPVGGGGVGTGDDGGVGSSATSVINPFANPLH